MDTNAIKGFTALFYQNQEGFSVFENGQTRYESREISPYFIERHLKGEITVGLCPVYFGNFCLWGCIDLDNHTGKQFLDPRALSDILPSNFIFSTSKRGGLHAYALFKRPVSAEVAIFYLKKHETEILKAYPDCQVEIFPKQTSLASGSKGSTIALPYGYKGFYLDRSKACEALFFGQKLEKSFLENKIFLGPPCLEEYTAREGMRNAYLFNVGVYAKKVGLSFTDIAPIFANPLPDAKELKALEKSIAKADYNYSCHSEPCATLCNKGLCENRTYGIRHKFNSIKEQEEGKTTEAFQVLTSEQVLGCTRYLGDSVFFEFNIKTASGDICPVKMTIEDALSPVKFTHRVLERAQVVVKIEPSLKKGWQDLMSAYLTKAETVDLTEGGTLIGKLAVEFNDFFKRCYRVQSVAEREAALNMGYSFIDSIAPDPLCVYFVGKNLLSHLKRTRSDLDLRTTNFYIALSQLGAVHKVVNIGSRKTRGVYAFSIADLDAQGILYSSHPFPARLGSRSDVVDALPEVKDDFEEF